MEAFLCALAPSIRPIPGARNGIGLQILGGNQGVGASAPT